MQSAFRTEAARAEAASLPSRILVHLLHSATDETHLGRSRLSTTPGGTGYRLGLDRRRSQTLREQARLAVIRAIRARRPGFRLGQRLTTLALARANPIHRNTLTHAMNDLVRLGYLRRIPKHGFEVVERTPDRPALLTVHPLARRSQSLASSSPYGA